MHQLRVLLLVLAALGIVLSAVVRRLGFTGGTSRFIRIVAISMAMISIGTFWLLVALQD